jgi:hypothetical protein
VKFETWRNVRWVGPQGSEAFFRETEKNREKSGETGIKIFRGPLDVSGDAGWRDPQECLGVFSPLLRLYHFLTNPWFITSKI